MICTSLCPSLASRARGVAIGVGALLLLLPSSVAQAELEYLGPELRVSSTLPLAERGQNFTWAGSVTGQGDGLMNADLARASFGVQGSGIKIGIISDSFNYLGGATTGVVTGDLPGAANPDGYLAPVTVLRDDLFPGNLDEGRAIAEVLHDIAPGAELMFHSAFNNHQSSPGGSIAAAIDNLVAAGCNVIVDDVFSLGAPHYQDGAAARAVNRAFASGVAYFSSAGNSSNNAYEGIYNARDENHDFDANANEGGDILLNIGTISSGSTVYAGLWWDDPYASLGGTPTSDFQLGLYNLTDNAVEGGSSQDQFNGADPFEAFGFTNTSGVAKEYALFVEHAGGDLNKRLKIQVFGGLLQDDDDTDSPTIAGHTAAAGALAVGAAPFYDPNMAESYSSFGPTTILIDEDGNRLATPEIRNTPSLVGIDGVNTSFFLADTAMDPDSFPNFFGTSASAPHVAAIAALMLERAAQLGVSLLPGELYQMLMQSTIDIGAPGYDFVTGYGRLDAQLALAAVVATAPEPGAMTLLLMAIAPAAAWRSRRPPRRD